MQRLSNGTQVNAIPVPGPVLGTPGYATPGVVGVLPASELDIDSINGIQEEIAHVIESAGITLDKTSNVQLLAALTALFAGEGGLAAEIAARIAGDAALNANLGAEENARSAEDGVLNAGIAAEGQARGAGDAALNTAIGNEAAARSGEDAALNAAIVAEAVARSAEDVSLSDALGAEANARAAFQAAFGAGINANGWLSFPSGIIIQWGVGGTDGTVEVAFPTTFPNNCWTVVGCEADSSGWLGGGTLHPTIHAPTGRTNSGFEMISTEILQSGGVQYAAGSSYFYFAVGN